MTDEILRYLTSDCIKGFIVFQAAVLLIVLSNSYVLRRVGRHSPVAEKPHVSLLVPCRNEEANIRACVRSLLAQTYSHMELIVLDDQSNDDTRTILEEEQARDPRLLVLSGAALPSSWTGKNWACHQLSIAARGDILFFADADTVFVAPDAVEKIVSTFEGERADLLSGLPRQVMRTFGEKVLVPMFYWAFFSFTPLVAGLVSRRAAVARVVGQIMVFRRDAYLAVGGHAAIRHSIVDDIDLAKRVRKAGLVCRVMDATAIVSCRMYRSGREACDGFSKNLFAAFGYAVLPYAFVWLWLGFVFCEPVVMLALHMAHPDRVPVRPMLLVTTVVLALVHWIFTHIRLHLPVWPACLCPLTMVAYELVALRSLVDGLGGKTTWRGRSISKPPVRLI
ncbi:MAG: glycosyltransferase [Coriobacteriia bacterium]|nr:glycosyltransferase [Coriobacteriia bacterium]